MQGPSLIYYWFPPRSQSNQMFCLFRKKGAAAFEEKKIKSYFVPFKLEPVKNRAIKLFYPSIQLEIHETPSKRNAS